MPSRDWSQIDALFAAALEHPPERRATFLAEATGGNTDVVDRVVALLNSLDTAERLIGESADRLVSAPVLDEPADDVLAAGERLGAYVVREEIGRGGMGRVYRGARADAAFEREVAIKVMARSAASELVVRRFASERRLLATLEHPGIARLYDGGMTDDGRPYLVMELIAGTRIDRHVADGGLDLARRLTLFEAVCDAVAYAHQRLVVHRDLKPANILVTAEERVVLLDFGIARLLNDGAEATRAGHRLLTPEYASPEQFRDEAASAAMDVYALGVLLHELLTGTRPPWQRLVQSGAADDAVERAMVPPSSAARNGPPPREGAPTSVASRQLRGDLDTIVLTALAVTPGRRYASVEALRDDVRRVRTGFPIHARRAPWQERARKFVRRNTALSAVGGLAVILAVGYVATVLIQSRLIAAERDRATLQGQRADQVAKVLVDLFAANDPFARGRPDTVRVGDFLQSGAARVEAELAGQPVVQGTVFTVLGRALRGLGRNDESREWLGKAERRLRDAPSSEPEALAEVLGEIGQLAQAETRRDTAERYFREALALLEGVPTTPPSKLANALLPAGAMLMFRGQLDSAQLFLDRAAAVLRRLPVPDSALQASYLGVRGDYHYRRAQPESAVVLIQEAFAINRARLGPDHPRVLLQQGNVAFALTTVGRNQEAIAIYEESTMRIRKRLGLAHPAVVEQLRTLAAAYSREGRLVFAESTMREAVSGARALGASSTDLAETLDAFGQFMERAGRPREAEPAYLEARAINRRVYGDRHPIVAILGARLSNLQCQATGQQAAGERALREAVRAIDAAFPRGEPVRMKVHSDLGLCIARGGDVSAARAELQANFDAALEERGAAHPMVQNVGKALAAFYDGQGDAEAAARVRAVLATPPAGGKR